MTYQQAESLISSLMKFGSKPGLTRIKKLLNNIGDPQKSLKIIHVAGTNGKGSVCFTLASIFKECGYKTGLYISPAVTDFRERMQINNKNISKKKLCSLMSFFSPYIKNSITQNNSITEFELTTAMAFKFFKDENCDVVILETGMGGRLDATNIIKKPIISIITSISLDHTAILGNSIEKIAKEKFGIIKRCVPAVLAPNQDKSVQELASAVSEKLKSPLTAAAAADIKNISYSLSSGTSFTYKNIKLSTPLHGEHQMENIAAVLAALEILKFQFNLPVQCIKRGIKKTHIPCRLEIVNSAPLIILDGAHNPAGAKTLAQFIDKYLHGRTIVGVMGVFKDKDADAILSAIAPAINKLVIASPPSERAMALPHLKNIAKKYNKNVVTALNIDFAMKSALKLSSSDGAVIVFGSFSLMNQAKKFIKNIYTHKI